jgi:hypothetical protein
MGNHWTKKIKKRRKLEEARLSLLRWCNKKAYDSGGFYTTETGDFFESHPEYVEFKSILKVNWNLMHDLNDESDATGIPEVTTQEDN